MLATPYKMAEKDEATPRGYKKSLLFTYNILDIKDELDERLEKCHRELLSATSSLRDAELFDQLNIKVSRSHVDHEETMMALLFSILTDPSLAHKSYSTLTLVTRDGMGVIIHVAELLVLEKLPKLLENTRIQLMWLTKELIKTGVSGTDRLCFAFLKQMPAGSTAPADVWLAENLLHLFLDNMAWLEAQPPLIISVVFTYLSILPTHLCVSSLNQLKNEEINFLISLLRNKFIECIQIGRDLIRLLQNVSRVPEFTHFWYDLLHHPERLDPSFTGIGQVLSRRTSRRFVAGRIVTDSEIKVNFLLSKVKFGQHKRYQEWFSKKYLSTNESLTVIPELIRFVCCVIHPPNEVLGSDILPRWAFIGWLLTLAQPHPVVLADAKLALFYDWLNYSSNTDNIMNIEPAALLMFHSLRSHPQMTQSLLDFLCRLTTQFNPQSSIGGGIQAAFHDIVSKGVLVSLDPLLCSPRLDQELRELIKTTFPSLYPQDQEVAATPTTDPEVNSVVIDVGDNNEEEEDDCLVIATDEELTAEDEEIASILLHDDNSDVWANVSAVPSSLADKMEKFRANSDSVELLRDILEFPDLKDYTDYIIKPLTHCLMDDFDLPYSEVTHDRPLGVLLRSNLYQLMSGIRECQWKMGYYILSHHYHSDSLQYATYSNYLPNGSKLQAILLRDLKICADEDSELFFTLLPVLYAEFPEELVGSSEMINIIVSHIDPYQLNSLIIKLSLKKLILFGKPHLQDIVVNSLQWDSFEQFSLWQLIIAEGPEIHHVVNILRHVTSPLEVPEAISGILLLFKTEPSIPGAVGNLLSLPLATHGEIVMVTISRWINSKPNKLAKFIDYCLNKVSKLSDPFPTLSTMLDHLENILKYLNGPDLFKGFEYGLSISLDKLFTKHQSLSTRCPKLLVSIKDALSSMPQSQTEKRHTPSIEEEIVRPKKRRVATLEELSD